MLCTSSKYKECEHYALQTNTNKNKFKGGGQMEIVSKILIWLLFLKKKKKNILLKPGT